MDALLSRSGSWGPRDLRCRRCLPFATPECRPPHGGPVTRVHPAPFPLELAERLIRMFSFVGDTVLDPFAGTATTNVAAARWGRNSIGVEVDSHYFNLALERLRRETTSLFGHTQIDAVRR